MRPSEPIPAVKQLLFVDPSAAVSGGIERDYGQRVHVVGCRGFVEARARLLDGAPDILVTNLRLADYNGLHLVLLVKAAHRRTVCIVHTDRPDLLLIREAQANGAFYERTDRLAHALSGYIDATLPIKDRRNPERFDRRLEFRGGRRAADLPIVV